jgi:O-antigen/teichoic acid export membrane protein
VTDVRDQSDSPEPAPPAPASRNASPRAVAINALSAYATLFGGALVGFVTTPLLLHALGQLRFGTFSLLVAATAYLGLLELGIGTSTTTRVASLELDGPDALQTVLSTSLALYAVVALGMLVLTAALSVLVPQIFNIPTALHHDSTFAFVILCIAQVASTPALALSAFLLGTGRMHQLNTIGFVIATAVSFATVGVALSDRSLPLLATVQVIGAVLGFVVFWFHTRRQFPAIRPRLRHARRLTARRLLGLGWRNSVTAICGTLAYSSDLVLIGILLNPRAAAAYAIALRGYAFIQRLTTSAIGALAPTHSHRAATADAAARFDLFCLSIFVSLILALACGITTAFYAHALLHLWLGTVPAHSSTIVIIFCVVLVLQVPGNASSTFLISSELVSASMRLTIFSATLNVVASILLTADVGVTGPALGTLIASATFELVVFPNLVCRLLGYSYLDLVKRAGRPLLLPALVLAAALLLDRSVATSGIVVVPLAGAACVVYGLTLWLSPEVRRLQQRLRHA